MKMCECGCGQPAPLATMTNKKWGHVKGEPVRFIRGHHVRKPRPIIELAELTWLAGLLEGEGSFILHRRKRTPKNRPAWEQSLPRIQVQMKDEDVIARVARDFGSTYWRGKSGMYAAAVSGYYAFDLMRSLYPHMGSRRKVQIDHCLSVNKPS